MTVTEITAVPTSRSQSMEQPPMGRRAKRRSTRISFIVEFSAEEIDGKDAPKRSSIIQVEFNEVAERSEGMMRAFVAAMIMLMATLTGYQAQLANDARRVEIDNSLFIPGGGVSALFYMFGQLKSIPREELLNQVNVCNSAGCAALFAVLLEWEDEDLLDVAADIQGKYLDGEYHRQEVSQRLWDHIVGSMDFENDNIPDWFSNVRVLTSTSETLQAAGDKPLSATEIASSLWTMESAMHTPTSKEHVADIALQSAWVPVALAPAFHHKGHNDGGFTSHLHPKCTRSIPYIYSYEMMRYSADPSISRELQEKFIAAGRSGNLPN